MKENTQSMDLFESLEIYIPVEAEVKSIPLWSLPNSVLRWMGLPLSDNDGSRKLAESPEGIWISPAVIRRKGQKLARAGNSVTENMSALMGRECRTAPGPFRMSIVSSNRAAHRLLKDTMPGKTVSSRKPDIPVLAPGAARKTYQDAVVIYQGRIFLSIRNPNRSQSQHKAQPASLSSVPSTSALPSETRKRQLPQASAEPADKEPQRKKMCLTLRKISPKQMEDVLTRTDSHSSTDQELLNDNSPRENHTSCKGAHSKNREEVPHKEGYVSSSSTACFAPQSTASVHKENSNCHKDARGQQVAEDGADLRPSWFQEQATSDCESQDLVNEEPESTSQIIDMDTNIQIDSGGPDNIVDFFEHSGNLSWTRTESTGAAFASTSQQQEVDFRNLAQEDEIAQMKAKLRQRAAALNNLPSSL